LKWVISQERVWRRALSAEKSARGRRRGSHLPGGVKCRFAEEGGKRQERSTTAESCDAAEGKIWEKEENL